MIFVNTRGGAADCSAVADTVRLVRGSRFFLRIETTSTDVQLQSANKTASIGEGPLACRSPASKTTPWPLSERPSNSISLVQTVSATIRFSLNSPDTRFNRSVFKLSTLEINSASRVSYPRTKPPPRRHLRQHRLKLLRPHTILESPLHPIQNPH